MACDAQELLDQAQCFVCLTTPIQEAIQIALLCEIRDQLAASATSSGSFPIPMGVDTVTVNDETWASPPTSVVASISTSDGEDIILPNVVHTSYATTGFKANLSGVTTSANYVINYTASFS